MRWAYASFQSPDLPPFYWELTARMKTSSTAVLTEYESNKNKGNVK